MLQINEFERKNMVTMLSNVKVSIVDGSQNIIEIISFLNNLKPIVENKKEVENGDSKPK